jgi:hypothetical protein
MLILSIETGIIRWNIECIVKNESVVVDCQKINKGDDVFLSELSTAIVLESVSADALGGRT